MEKKKEVAKKMESEGKVYYPGRDKALIRKINRMYPGLKINGKKIGE